jgi:hypothetical protein
MDGSRFGEVVPEADRHPIPFSKLQSGTRELTVVGEHVGRGAWHE